jgi:hypothetical protein
LPEIINEYQAGYAARVLSGGGGGRLGRKFFTGINKEKGEIYYDKNS